MIARVILQFYYTSALRRELHGLSQSVAMSLFTVKNDTLVVRLKAGQMSTSTLGKIFNIFLTSLFLVGSDGTVATPDEEGDFDTYDNYVS